MRLLFETPEVAREVAFMLQYEYGGFTMMTLPSIHDTLPLRTAIELTGADFCFADDHYRLVLALEANALTRVSASQKVERISRKAELWQDVAPF